MDVPPNRCAVVEDSASGVMAGLAAGMSVFAYSGGVTDGAQLSVGSAVLFDDMSALPNLILDDGGCDERRDRGPHQGAS